MLGGMRLSQGAQIYVRAVRDHRGSPGRTLEATVVHVMSVPGLPRSGPLPAPPSRERHWHKEDPQVMASKSRAVDQLQVASTPRSPSIGRRPAAESPRCAQAPEAPFRPFQVRDARF
jgi:hypothetical protein